MAVTWFDGFEHGVVSTAGGGLYDSLAGSPTIVTTSPRSGSRCLECAVSGGTNVGIAKTISGTTLVGVAYIYLASSATPSVDLRLLEGRTTDGITHRYCRIGVNTAGKLFADVYDGGVVTSQVAATAMSADTWYRVDFRMICNAGGSSNTFTIDVEWATGDGSATALTQVSSVRGTGNNFDEFRCGPATGSSFTHTVRFDDVALSSTSGDYPLGPVKVLGYSPNAVGTHSLDAATSSFYFKNDGSDTAITTSETTSYLVIDDVPLSSGSDYLKVQAGGGSPAGTEYLEYGFADSAETSDPLAVRAAIAIRNDSGTTPNSITAKLRANSNETNIFSGDIGSASVIYKSLMSAAAPGGAAWTDTIFDAATLRWGYTSDTDSTPRLESALLEALFAVSANTITPQSLSATVTATASVVRSVGKSLVGTSTLTAAVSASKAFLQILAASVGATASITKQVGKGVSASVVSSASVVKRVSKTLVATATSSSAINAVFQAAAAGVAKLRTLMGFGQ